MGDHIGTSSSPASVLDQETPEKSVPLQFMMDGEVVAWRVNRDYAAIVESLQKGDNTYEQRDDSGKVADIKGKINALG
jgi:hypothetical protein